MHIKYSIEKNEKSRLEDTYCIYFSVMLGNAQWKVITHHHTYRKIGLCILKSNRLIRLALY